VLGNLLNNAAKYTDRGGRIRLWTSQSSPDAIAIHVRDSGIGLDPASLTRVFEMFSQVTSSIERSEGGLGIGLALVRGLVEMHGGRVEARSDGPGRGSEFVVQLPLPTTVPDVAEAPLRAPTAPPASRRILVADDNVDAAESLALLLRLEGHAVEVVHDGAQAVAAVARERPDVALLDIGMPRLNGYEAAQRLRALATADDAPMLLVAVTGWGQRDDRRRASAAGFDHHLTKPVDFERLRELVLARPAEVAAQSSGEVGFNGSRSRMEEWSGVPLPQHR
jgi:CheY-like chemotaxis protein